MNQKIFLNIISRYFNTGSIQRSDKILSAIMPDWPLIRNAGNIRDKFTSLILPENRSPIKTYNVEKYTGNDQTALNISAYIKKHLASDLVCAIVHGSIATAEKINYSDFDGLVIIKSEVFSDSVRIRYVAEHLSKTYSIMIKGDPLQHHGWFVLTENDIACWPSSYFPPVILNYSRSLLGDNVQLNIRCSENPDEVKANLFRMAASITKTLSTGNFPDNAYQLKSLLSEFMLLPTLFLQAIRGEGIYKKHSFTDAKNQVPPEIWQVMDVISLMRETWNINSGIVLPDKPIIITPGIKKKQVTSSHKIPDDIRMKLNNKLREDMLQLARFFVDHT